MSGAARLIVIWLGAVVAVVTVCGCSTESSLFVELRTDLQVDVDFERVMVERSRADFGDPEDLEEVRLSIRDDLIDGVRVAEFNDLEEGTHRVRVVLFDSEDAEVGVAKIVVDVSGTTAVTALITAQCADIDCPGQQTCYGDRCVNPLCTPQTPEACGSAECADDSDCTALVSCGQGLCVGMECLTVAVLGACAEDEVCSPIGGCTRIGGSDCVDGTPCAGEGGCEVGAVDCSSGTEVCVTSGIATAGTSCREALGECDLEELCDGTSAVCPADVVAMAGSTCSEGTCDGLGACSAGCTAGAPCGTGDPCAIGEIDCTTGEPSCVSSRPAPAGTECRAAAAVCDAAEECDGVSMACPSDEFVVGTECRADDGECDVAESCTGDSPTCPADGFETAGTSCSIGSCDGLGTCTTCTPGASCGTGDACQLGQMACGATPSCMPTGPAPAGTECRASSGAACDRREVCDGVSTSCPPDSPTPSGTVCRSAMGGCDIAEECDGVAFGCPANSFQSTGVTCRAASGGCDVAETCAGTAACPADAVRPSSHVCRGSSDTCDVAETCDGSSKTCPTNRFEPTGTVCRMASGMCDATETCTGTGASCPADGDAPDGTTCVSCSAGTNCECQSGSCIDLGGPQTVLVRFGGMSSPSGPTIQAQCVGGPSCTATPSTPCNLTCDTGQTVTFDCDMNFTSGGIIVAVVQNSPSTTCPGTIPGAPVTSYTCQAEVGITAMRMDCVLE